MAETALMITGQVVENKDKKRFEIPKWSDLLQRKGILGSVARLTEKVRTFFSRERKDKELPKATPTTEARAKLNNAGYWAILVEAQKARNEDKPVTKDLPILDGQNPNPDLVAAHIIQQICEAAYKGNNINFEDTFAAQTIKEYLTANNKTIYEYLAENGYPITKLADTIAALASEAAGNEVPENQQETTTPAPEVIDANVAAEREKFKAKIFNNTPTPTSYWNLFKRAHNTHLIGKIDWVYTPAINTDNPDMADVAARLILAKLTNNDALKKTAYDELANYLKFTVNKDKTVQERAQITISDTDIDAFIEQGGYKDELINQIVEQVKKEAEVKSEQIRFKIENSSHWPKIQANIDTNKPLNEGLAMDADPTATSLDDAVVMAMSYIEGSNPSYGTIKEGLKLHDMDDEATLRRLAAEWKKERQEKYIKARLEVARARLSDLGYWKLIDQRRAFKTPSEEQKNSDEYKAYAKELQDLKTAFAEKKATPEQVLILVLLGEVPYRKREVKQALDAADYPEDVIILLGKEAGVTIDRQPLWKAAINGTSVEDLADKYGMDPEEVRRHLRSKVPANGLLMFGGSLAFRAGLTGAAGLNPLVSGAAAGIAVDAYRVAAGGADVFFDNAAQNTSAALFGGKDESLTERIRNERRSGIGGAAMWALRKLGILFNAPGSALTQVVIGVTRHRAEASNLIDKMGISVDQQTKDIDSIQLETIVKEAINSGNFRQVQKLANELATLARYQYGASDVYGETGSRPNKEANGLLDRFRHYVNPEHGAEQLAQLHEKLVATVDKLLDESPKIQTMREHRAANTLTAEDMPRLALENEWKRTKDRAKTIGVLALGTAVVFRTVTNVASGMAFVEAGKVAVDLGRDVVRGIGYVAERGIDALRGRNEAEAFNPALDGMRVQTGVRQGVEAARNQPPAPGSWAAAREILNNARPGRSIIEDANIKPDGGMLWTHYQNMGLPGRGVNVANDVTQAVNKVINPDWSANAIGPRQTFDFLNRVPSSQELQGMSGQFLLKPEQAQRLSEAVQNYNNYSGETRTLLEGLYKGTVDTDNLVNNPDDLQKLLRIAVETNGAQV
ncbi:MAG TPA: hypothetical protein VD999_02335 [Vitreimonas sp.]|nr:hypothetical protein [Vitreimonas sp.]